MRLLFTLLCSLLTILLGCGDNSRPKDLPTLYPCTITITQDGKPLAEAAVELVPQDAENAKYRAVSQTAEDGTVKMSTYGFPGVPQGMYKVVVSKRYNEPVGKPVLNPSTRQEEYASYNKLQLVETQYLSAETTPFELDITGKEKNVTKTFDVGKAVKDKVK